MAGLTHIYCGDGKGKTTAALGLAVRCAGSGRQVLLLQFSLRTQTTNQKMATSQVTTTVTIRKIHPLQALVSSALLMVTLLPPSPSSLVLLPL